MTESNYWQGPMNRRLRRRGMLRGTALGGAALAFAAACGGSSNSGGNTNSGSSNSSQPGNPTAAGRAGGTPAAGAAPATAAAAAAAGAQPKYGGSLVSPLQKEPTNYDPHLQADSSKVGFHDMTLNGLVRLKTVGITDSQSLVVEPDLLASMPESPDKTTLLLKLRPGVKWQNLAPVNGRAFDAQDIKYNIDRMKLDTQADGGANEHSYIQQPVDSVTVIDPQTVQVKFKTPSPLWINFMATGYQKVIAREVTTPTTVMVGTGPFIMTQHDRDAQATFKKNPVYFKQGLPYLDEFIWRADGTIAHQVAGLKTGDYGFGAANPQDFQDLKKANPKIVEQKYLGLGYPCGGFDLTVQKLQDKRVRQAISLAVDWDGVIKALYDGDGYRVPPIPAGFAQYTAKPKDTPQYYEYNVAKAKQLMQAAGYDANKPLQIEIETDTAYPENIKMQPIMQEALKQIFVNVTALPTLPPTDFLGKRNSPGTGWTVRLWNHAAFGEPDEFLSAFYHTTGSRNYGKWGGPELDALIEKQRGDVTTDERAKVLMDIQKYLADQMYRFGLVSPTPRQALQPWLKGMVTLAAETGYQGLQVENSWIDKS